MAKQVIGIGTTANDGTGDPIRTAFDKTNDNFTELYDGAGVLDDSISFAKLADEFTTADTLTAAATVNIDFSAAEVFTLTPDQNTTFNITNPKIGITKTIIVTGAGGSYTADTWTVGGSSGTFNKIGGTYDDTTSTKNFYQITCVSATEFWYSINQIA
jgi:hypothetical protein